MLDLPPARSIMKEHGVRMQSATPRHCSACAHVAMKRQPPSFRQRE
jgi:hypothetical protein